MKFGNDKMNIKGLDALEGILQREGISVKIGILGKADSRTGEGEPNNDEDSDIDNAGIGLVHEFGTENMEQRSWLRMPLELKFQSALENAGAFNKKTMDKVIREKSFVSMAKKNWNSCGGSYCNCIRYRRVW